ncbi:hypothetical protein GCM10025867_49890 (plasmid) [Frondihabitans sucicola]|uniref:Uncharacterized protein n=1 Tax=Frondihabitans sucicola TaxID=1268041 RepID=A0ABM8GW98_9MICO|nr:hypothetical protein [Frondihabitans sucicola]BDZ52748.1 hypothetical protein GCM10025867_49890 [Frondihabitans sucicola]
MTDSTNPFRGAERRFDAKDRIVKIEVIHQEMQTARGWGAVSLKLVVQHSGKNFVAHLNRGVLVGNVRHQQITYGRDGLINVVALPAIPVARYSQKGLEAAVEAALEVLDDAWGSDQRLAAFARPFDEDEVK